MVKAARRGAERGITYLALLLAVALTSGALAAAATVWSHQQRREREVQLLWVGEQYRRAIESYANAPGTPEGTEASRYPKELADLLDDRRTPVPRRHLRRLFHDPMTHSNEWGLVRDEKGGITGVYSLDDGKPIKRARFPRRYAAFESAKSYQDWRFGVIRSAGEAAAEAARAARSINAAAAAAAASAAAAGGDPQNAPGGPPGSPTNGRPGAPPPSATSDPPADEDVPADAEDAGMPSNEPPPPEDPPDAPPAEEDPAPEEPAAETPPPAPPASAPAQSPDRPRF